MSDDPPDDEGTNPTDDRPHLGLESDGTPGFVAPEQRSWVHPSELRAGISGSQVFSVNPVPAPATGTPQPRRRTLGAIAIGMTVACAALAVIAVLDRPSSGTEADAGTNVGSASLVRGVVTSVVSSGAWIGLDGKGDRHRDAPVLRVTAVVDDGPAALAGLEAGDELISIAGHPVASMSDVSKTLQLLQPDNTVELVMWRNGKRSDVNVILGSPPPA